jgi:hypothetical protein
LVRRKAKFLGTKGDEKSMGQGFLYENKILCENCYQDTLDRKIHKEEIPEKKRCKVKSVIDTGRP